MDLLERYRRAIEWTAPKVAARTPELDVQGRWVDDARFEYLAPSPLQSPDGRFECFVKGYDLWLRERATGEERPLTQDGTHDRRFGQEPESGLAAVSYRKAPYAVGLWSSDSRWFLTHAIDERGMPEVTLGPHRFKYAMPGDPLGVVTYVAIHAASGRRVVFPDVTAPLMIYSPFSLRMAWFDEPGRACFVRFDRYRRQVDLVVLEIDRGTGRVVFTETVEGGYIALNPMYVRRPNVHTLPRSGEFIWYSERDGWGHLYLHDEATGNLKSRITSGEWVVRDIVHVDEKARKVIFLAGALDPRVDPMRRSLCKANLDGGGFEVLLAHEGDVYAAPGSVSPNGKRIVVRKMSAVSGNSIEIFDLATRRGVEAAAARPEAGEVVPRPFTVLAADGETPLHGLLYVPLDFDENRRYPLVAYVYPGPQITSVPQRFRATTAGQAASLAQLGFVTMMIDTRGMPGRSRALHQAGYGELLEPQLSDYAAAVKQLVHRHAFLDPARVGIFGYSAGGAGTFRAMCDYASTFKVGVSVCGNHDAARYSSGWSDRYRGPPQPGKWASQANATVAHKFEGKLLLITGDMDDNVLPTHTYEVAEALEKAGKQYELLVVPGAGHDVLMTSTQAIVRTWDFFVKHLLGSEPPGFEPEAYTPEELARYHRAASRELME